MILHDEDIRESLFEFLETTYGKVRILEEKNIGRSRADVVMITEDSLFGLEIKSDADTYARLAGQIKDYDKYYDYNYVVVGSSHARHIEEHVPDHWGIITVEWAEDALDFYILRKPVKNPKVKLKTKLKILWRPELATLQEWHSMPKYKEKSKDFVIDKILERTKYPADKKGYIDQEALSREVSALLFERDYTTIAKTLMEYRKGELQKKIDAETDPVKRLELLQLQEKKVKAIGKRKFKKRRRRFTARR